MNRLLVVLIKKIMVTMNLRILKRIDMRASSMDLMIW